MRSLRKEGLEGKGSKEQEEMEVEVYFPLLFLLGVTLASSSSFFLSTWLYLKPPLLHFFFLLPTYDDLLTKEMILVGFLMKVINKHPVTVQVS